MIYNGSRKIKDDGGDYIVFTDYGSEGFCVSAQLKTLPDAIAWMINNPSDNPRTIVKLVVVELTEK